MAYRLLLLLGVAAAAAWALAAVWAFTIDDAGISYAYAKHIAEGLGPVAMPGGPRVEGYSNPLWVFLLVPLYALGFALPAVAKVAGTIAFALGLSAGAATIALADGRRASAFGGAEAAFAAASALCLELVVWVPAGLENALFMAALLGMVYFDARESELGTRWPLSGVCAFALSITRPEGVVYAAPLLLVKLVGLLRRREPARQALGAALSFVLLLALYHVVHFAVFAQLVPNTYFAKPPGRDWLKGYEYVTTTARESGLWYALPLAALGLWGRPRLKLLLAWSALAGVGFATYAGGDWMPHGRFMSLFAPSLLALAALGLCRIGRIARKLARGRLPAEAVAFGAGALLLAGWAQYQLPRLKGLRTQHWCHFCERVADTGRVVRLAAGAALETHSLLTHDYGGPSWLSSDSFAPLDFLGLCDRSAALLRSRRLPGSVGSDPRLYQYFIQEQPSAPSWVLLPPNFWPAFDRSPEYRWDYYPLDTRALAYTRRDAYFVLHRGELVDFFPPVPSAEFRALGERWMLVGYAAFADDAGPARAEPGARARVFVSLVPRGRARAGDRVVLRAQAGAEYSESRALSIDRGLSGLARALDPGEPLALELSIELPRAPGPYRLGLELSQTGRGAGPPSVLELGELGAGAELPAFVRDVPRYPSALPVPRAPELVRARKAVWASIDSSRRAGRALGGDAALARELAAAGSALEARGELEQAYLADVWATQVDARAWEALADSVFRLRPPSREQHTTELSLLRRYYSSGQAQRLSELSAYYLSQRRLPEARHFIDRWRGPSDEPLVLALREALARGEAALAAETAAPPEDEPALALVAVDPLAGALDFESESLAGWEGAQAAFRAGARADRHGLVGLRGSHQDGVLSSLGSGQRGRGALLSPEFTLNGSTLSLLVGGGAAKRQTGVELLVDGAVVLSASGNDSDNLLPVFWDVRSYAGKRARLRVFDRSVRDHVLLDRVLLWR